MHANFVEKTKIHSKNVFLVPFILNSNNLKLEFESCFVVSTVRVCLVECCLFCSTAQVCGFKWTKVSPILLNWCPTPKSTSPNWWLSFSFAISTFWSLSSVTIPLTLFCHFWMHQLCHFLLHLSTFHNDTSVVFFPMSSHLEKGVEPWSRKAWSTFRHARHGSSHCLVFEQTWRQPQFICWQWLIMMQAKKCAFGFVRVLWWIKNCRKLHFWEFSFPFGECQMIFCLFCLFTFLTTLLALVFWLSWPWLSWSTTAIFVRVPEVTSAPNVSWISAPNVSWMDGLAFWLWQWKWIWRCFGNSTDKLESSWRAVGDELESS